MCLINIKRDEEYRMPLATKIIATIGPACDSSKILTRLLEEGVNIFRFNMSHGDHAYHKKVIEAVRALGTWYGHSPLILVDLQGPKLRVGKMKAGSAYLETGSVVSLTTKQISGDESRVPIQVLGSLTAIQPGERIFFDDGLLETVVIETRETELVVQIIVGGQLTDRKGMNFPDSTLDIPPLTEKDYEDARFAVENGADRIALSFVQKASDVEALRVYLSDLGHPIPIISKVEKPKAIDNIDSIIEASDGVMIARGDLGVEVDDYMVPIHQKNIVHKCQQKEKFVIVATQMLDSMIRNPKPTRAEASDVANAVYDGASAVMLSGETANGAHPVKSVQKMAAIVTATEKNIAEKKFMATSSFTSSCSPMLSYPIPNSLLVHQFNSYRKPYITTYTNIH